MLQKVNAHGPITPHVNPTLETIPYFVFVAILNATIRTK